MEETSYLSPGVHLNGEDTSGNPNPPRSPTISPGNSLSIGRRQGGPNNGDTLYSNQMYNHGSNGNLYEDMSAAAPSAFNPRYHSWQYYDKYDSVVSDRQRISNNVLCIAVGILFTISTLISVGALALSMWVAIHQMALINNTTDTVITLTAQMSSLQAAIGDIREDIQIFIPEEGSVVLPQCGQGFWERIVYINMSDPTQSCPNVWREYTQGDNRACGRPLNDPIGCHSVRFPSNGLYNRVCGRVRGFGYETPDAFQRFTQLPSGTPDDNYVDGVSVTHGSVPRRHIWTFAGTTYGNCPCAVFPANDTIGPPPPEYVGGNYFCESGLHGNVPAQPMTVYTNNTLWDGKGCLTSLCCNYNTPPWFSVEVLPSSDDIEVRLCGDQLITDEDVVVQLIELYVQ